VTCLNITASAAPATNVTGSRWRSIGTVRTRGGMRIPAICIVAIRKFIAALPAALRRIPEV
jgi:hypothetical protein